ncbi:hypothetical protein [Sphaerochaeta sp.]|uniref:hypothetical protein n=1 Tax=Sphaerochaeta sp. TaxID=1972642 RepID=UPI003D0CB77E
MQKFKFVIKIVFSLTLMVSISYVFFVFAGDNKNSGNGNMLINGSNNSDNKVYNNFYNSSSKETKTNATIITNPVSHLFKHTDFNEMISQKNILCDFQINDNIELLSNFSGTTVKTAKVKVLTGKCKGKIGFIVPDSIK